MIAFHKMLELKLHVFLHWPHTLNITTIVAGCSLLCASILPWLKDPLGVVYSAWQLPLYSGWSYHIAFLNYGMLCLFCAIYMFICAFTSWQPYRKHRYFTSSDRITRLISITPV